MKNRIIINPNDNVAVLLEDELNINAGHKVALKDIFKDEPIIKYGEIIGRAIADIKKDDWVHTHNMKTHLNEGATYSYNPTLNNVERHEYYFNGYIRENGEVGIRNDIYIIPTVGCVNGICKKLEQEIQKYKKGSIDNIFALTHQFGCSQLGEDHENIKNLLINIALNANASYVLFVGLGCENNSLSKIKEELEKYNRTNIYFYNTQDVENDFEYGINLLKEMVNKASTLKREKAPLSALKVGLKCGGSDGFSGITANPTIGRVSDKVISFGGSTLLTEVPEMFGAEQTLMNKCKDQKTYENYVALINNFKNFYIQNNFPVYENPSPGNKEGGITTLEEKSCGCITKAGTTPVVDILDYTDRIKENGLSIINGPGNDLIAATLLGAAGCQVILFSTGRGTPFSTFVPTLKIGTNNHVSTFKKDWIDFNAYTMDDEGLFNLLVNTANGEYLAKSEFNHEIAFYKKGVTL